VEYWTNERFVPEEVEEMMPNIQLILALTERYAAIVMNPPYMGGGNMNEVLGKYVKKNYEEGKGDLATVFVKMMGERTQEKGLYGYIIPPSWMFLSTFEGLRKSLLSNQSIQSLLHLSRGVFGADFGSSAAVIKNYEDQQAKGTYFRLVERTFQEFDQNHLRMLFEQTLANHDFKYYFKDYDKEITELPYSENGNKIYYSDISQQNFNKIPGSPIGYWVSEKVLKTFDFSPFIEFGKGVKGLDSGDNSKYVRNVWEVDKKSTIWISYYSGGPFRKWYGNFIYFLNYKDVVSFKGACVRNKDLFFKPGFEWSRVSSNHFGVKYVDNSIFGGASQMAFVSDKNSLNKFIAIFNTKIVEFYIKFLNPTMITQAGDVNRIPICEQNILNIDIAVSQNIAISRLDWDAHETSWDFRQNELLRCKPSASNLLSDSVATYKQEWGQKFLQLHKNEEELNRQFIEIYGLQDELTPDVPLDEITILQQGEISIENNEIVWHDDIVIKQLISYAVGVWMGRYRLDKPGLHIAHPEPTSEELEAYSYGNETVNIDDDGIIPILPSGFSFEDNLCRRIADFVRIVFGADSLTENLNFIEKCLGTTIEQYVMKEYWKDHKKMYQNRPIYWLWSSKKGAFKVISYMHRMDAYTAERVRSKYLLPYIEYLNNKIADLESRAAQLSVGESRKLDALRKAHAECVEYHERLQVIAEQAIAFDLDDGVVVNYAKFGDVLAKIK
jgi:hypothetical protein